MATKDTCSTLAKVGTNEPIFVLRAQDVFAPDLVWWWAQLAALGGASQEKIKEAYACADAMRKWPTRKRPD